jgi:hypothetical protein
VIGCPRLSWSSVHHERSGFSGASAAKRRDWAGNHEREKQAARSSHPAFSTVARQRAKTFLSRRKQKHKRGPTYQLSAIPIAKSPVLLREISLQIKSFCMRETGASGKDKRLFVYRCATIPANN